MVLPLDLPLTPAQALGHLPSPPPTQVQNTPPVPLILAQALGHLPSPPPTQVQNTPPPTAAPAPTQPPPVAARRTRGKDLPFPSWASPDLIRKINALPAGKKRTQAIRNLSGLTQFERDRQNQSARMWVLGQAIPPLILPPTTSPSPVPPLARVAAGPPLTAAAHASQTTVSPTGTPTTSAPVTRGHGVSPPSITTASTSAADPAWHTKHMGIFLVEPMEPDEYQLWKESLDCWTIIERAHGFVGKGRAALGTASRPTEIALWIQNARNKRIDPKKPAAYISGWWKWWDGLNPKWRQRSNGRPIAGGSGDWSSLIKTGPNGFLTVFGSLLGLHTAAVAADWKAAVADVHWVLTRIAAEVQSGSAKRTSDGVSQEDDGDSDDADAPARRPKKKRRTY